jgi:glycosyltransferase involved in cell wall biosynthesis
MTASPQGTVLLAAGGWHDEAPGGANRLPTEFARYLARRGYRVAYVCASSHVAATSRTGIDGVDLWRYAGPRAPSPSLRNLWQHRERVTEVVRALESEGPLTALLGHGQLQYLAAARACARTTRRCYVAHSPLPLELASAGSGPVTWKRRLSWRAAWLLEQRLLARSDLVVCHSAYSRSLMESGYRRTIDGKVRVLPAWVDAGRFHPPEAGRDALRARLGPPWASGVPTFLSVRRLYPRMGLDLLIEAAAVVAAANVEHRVVIAGEGPERPRLEALAASRGLRDRLAFVGRVPDDLLLAGIGAADCVVLPTRSLECFGLTILEAYACGVPVIGTPVGAIPEVMGAAQADWVAREAGAAALADRMLAFLRGRLTADAAALRARAREFDLAAIAPLHEAAMLGPATQAPAPRAAAPIETVGADAR